LRREYAVAVIVTMEYSNSERAFNHRSCDQWPVCIHTRLPRQMSLNETEFPATLWSPHRQPRHRRNAPFARIRYCPDVPYREFATRSLAAPRSGLAIRKRDAAKPNHTRIARR